MLESRSSEAYATVSIIHGNTGVELSQDSLALDFSMQLHCSRQSSFSYSVFGSRMDPFANLM